LLLRFTWELPWTMGLHRDRRSGGKAGTGECELSAFSSSFLSAMPLHAAGAHMTHESSHIPNVHVQMWPNTRGVWSLSLRRHLPILAKDLAS